MLPCVLNDISPARLESGIMKGDSNKAELKEVHIKTSAAQADTNDCNKVKFSQRKNVWVSDVIRVTQY